MELADADPSIAPSSGRGRAGSEEAAPLLGTTFVSSESEDVVDERDESGPGDEQPDGTDRGCVPTGAAHPLYELQIAGRYQDAHHDADDEEDRHSDGEADDRDKGRIHCRRP